MVTDNRLQKKESVTMAWFVILKVLSAMIILSFLNAFEINASGSVLNSVIFTYFFIYFYFTDIIFVNYLGRNQHDKPHPGIL